MESIRRERDFFKQQMEYFRQQFNAQLARAPPLSATKSMDQDKGPRPPLTRVSFGLKNKFIDSLLVI